MVVSSSPHSKGIRRFEVKPRTQQLYERNGGWACVKWLKRYSEELPSALQIQTRMNARKGWKDCGGFDIRRSHIKTLKIKLLNGERILANRV